MTVNVEDVDLVVVGAGAAGLACAVHAVRAGARVLVCEKDSRIGGTLHLSGGHLAAAGTPEQAALGIEDSPARHRADIERISRGTARGDLVDVVVAEAADTLAWLGAAGFRPAPGTPRIVYGHEPYHTARTVHGPDEGASILAALETEVVDLVGTGRLVVRTGAPVSGLLTEGGAVVGVEVWLDGREQQVRAPVVLATGGYGAEPELFAELDGAPLVSAAARTSTGDGLLLGQSVGAGLQGRGSYLPTFGGLPDPVSPGRANWHDRLCLTSERDPVEIYVDRHGSRWVAEDEPSIDEKERALVGVENQTFWVVFDQAGLESGSGADLWVGRGPGEVGAAANTRPGVHRADSLSELAELAGIDPTGLVRGVGRYNDAVALGRDDDFGRTHLPAPIARGPYYAIRNHAITLITFTGLDIDADCAVRDETGQPIAGLYAVGEVIGAGATCGNSLCSGMLLTPALTLGRLLGARLGTSLGQAGGQPVESRPAGR